MPHKGIEIGTRVGKNTKEVDHGDFDRALPGKRALVETAFDQLKNWWQPEHTRH
jgi:hypothetical protein